MVSSNKQAKAPISTHPAFPAIVALWFAALLGIGSLIVPSVVFEQILAISGLAEIVPAAGAPLGFSTQLGIALAGTAIGTLAGLILARKLAGGGLRQGGSSGSEDDFPWAKPPICALEELGAASLDQSVEDEASVEPAAAELHSFAMPDETPDEAGIALPEGRPEVELAPQALGQNSPTGMSAEQLIRRPLDELGIVQLVERFALSLQQRPASAFHEQNSPFAAGEPDDDADEGEEFTSLLNLRKTSAARKSVELPEDRDSDPSEAVAVFPRQEGDSGQRKFTAPAAVTALGRQTWEKGTAADTERTLRGALEQLQKMSGAR